MTLVRKHFSSQLQSTMEMEASSTRVERASFKHPAISAAKTMTATFQRSGYTHILGMTAACRESSSSPRPVTYSYQPVMMVRARFGIRQLIGSAFALTRVTQRQLEISASLTMGESSFLPALIS